LHSSTGMVLYWTYATATEISEANKNLAWCAECYRYVLARLLAHGEAAGRPSVEPPGPTGAGALDLPAGPQVAVAVPELPAGAAADAQPAAVN